MLRIYQKCDNRGYTPGFVGIRQLLSKSLVAPLFVLELVEGFEDELEAPVVAATPYPLHNAHTKTCFSHFELFQSSSHAAFKFWTKTIPRSFGAISPRVSQRNDDDSATDAESSSSNTCVELSDNEVLPKDTGFLRRETCTDSLSISSINAAEIGDLFDLPVNPVVRIPKSEHHGRYAPHLTEVLNPQTSSTPLASDFGEDAITIRLPGMHQRIEIGHNNAGQNIPPNRPRRRRDTAPQPRTSVTYKSEARVPSAKGNSSHGAPRPMLPFSMGGEIQTRIPSHPSGAPLVSPSGRADPKTPTKTAASLLAILNGPISEPFQAAVYRNESATPVDKIASTDDPPLPKPIPIGSRRPHRPSWCSSPHQDTEMEFISSDEALPWPPVLPKRSLSF